MFERVRRRRVSDASSDANHTCSRKGSSSAKLLEFICLQGDEFLFVRLASDGSYEPTFSLRDFTNSEIKWAWKMPLFRIVTGFRDEKKLSLGSSYPSDNSKQPYPVRESEQ